MRYQKALVEWDPVKNKYVAQLGFPLGHLLTMLVGLDVKLVLEIIDVAIKPN